MEERKSKEAVIVGAFIVIRLTIFILTIFTLGGERKTFSTKIPVKVVFADINGLKEGNNIWFSGVKIGTVKKIDLKGGSNVEVTLNIEEKAQPYIRKDATAKISSEGLLGNKIVIISGGTSASAPVAENDYLKVEKVSDNEDILATLQLSNRNLLEITANFKIISKKIADGEGTLGKLINDPGLANTLQSTLANLRIVSANSKKVVSNINDFTVRMNKENSSLNKLFVDTILFDSIKMTVAELKTAVNTANEFAKNINEFTSDIKKASSKLNDTTNTMGILLNDKEMSAHLQTTIENLQSASKKLDEDLEAVRHNFLLRGYFRKKQKASTIQ